MVELMMGDLQIFIWGTFGGIVGEAFGWLEAAKSDPIPAYLGKKIYWFAALVIASIGGILCIAYNSSDPINNPWLCINLGASSPMILKSAAKGLKR